MNVLVDHVLKVSVLTEKTITAVPVIKVRNKVNILTCFLVCHNISSLKILKSVFFIVQQKSNILFLFHCQEHV
jgi:hypothetical protein